MSPEIPARAHAPAIRTTAVRKVFQRGRDEVVALDGVDLTIARGQVFGVLGTSGAGKSTLIRCLNGLERPTSGAVEVDGVDVTQLNRAALRALDEVGERERIRHRRAAASRAGARRAGSRKGRRSDRAGASAGTSASIAVGGNSGRRIGAV